MKYPGRITVEAQSRGIRKILTVFIIETENIKPLLGMEWLQEFNWLIRNIDGRTTRTDHAEKDQTIAKFEKLIKASLKIKITETEIQLHPGHPPIKQKTRTIPYYLQSYVEKQINKLLQSRHSEKTTKCGRGLVFLSGRNNRDD